RTADATMVGSATPPDGVGAPVSARRRREIAAGEESNVRIGVLASGGGTNLEAILGERLPVVVVVVDRPCRATEVAEAAGVTADVVERTSFGSDFDRVEYTHRVVDALQRHDVDVVVMAGFGTILEKPIHDAFPNRILNTHP